MGRNCSQQVPSGWAGKASEPCENSPDARSDENSKPGSTEPLRANEKAGNPEKESATKWHQKNYRQTDCTCTQREDSHRNEKRSPHRYTMVKNLQTTN